jgi:bifunctional N-acetylglucosamine-1-phosphate-uridyltransferase/glucosamine-1-phosphate-acetyltransferase GlmU-like protein
MRWLPAPPRPSGSSSSTGHGAEAVEAAVAEAETAICVRQEEQKGTGHAVLQAAAALDGFEGDAVVLYADTPFLTPETLDRDAPRGPITTSSCWASRRPIPGATVGW